MTTIKKQYELEAARPRVFEAWLSNDFVVPPVARYEVEHRVGGRFQMHMQEDMGGGKMTGEFIRYEENERLTYSWLWDWSPNVSTVDVVFSDRNGKTTIRLTHAGLDSEESIKNHSEGWDAYVSGLSALVK